MTIKNTLALVVSSLIMTGIVMALVSVLYPDIARGAISEFTPSSCYTAAATGTPTMVGVGGTTFATTTVACNLGLNGARTATLSTIFAASGTEAVLLTQIEYADTTSGVDCASNQDGCTWYGNNLDVYAAGAIAVATPSNSYTWTFASSTIGGITPLTSPPCFTGQLNRGDCSNKLVEIPTPTQYVRAVFTATGKPAAIRAEIIPRTNVN